MNDRGWAGCVGWNGNTTARTLASSDKNRNTVLVSMILVQGSLKAFNLANRPSPSTDFLKYLLGKSIANVFVKTLIMSYQGVMKKTT